jgi:dienelactone hydrolase
MKGYLEGTMRMAMIKTSLGLVTGLLAFSAMTLSASAEPVTFQAADGVKVFGDYQGSKDGSRPLILLFHQASSNQHEYDTIAPRLNGLGFDTLAIDQRSGGSAYGQTNKTAAAARSGPDFLAALPDLEAALAWGVTRGGAGAKSPKILVWGSSYSASLVFVLAAKNPDKVTGVLSFSPGEYFSSRSLVREAAAKVKVPVFVSSASDPGEIGEAKAILTSSAASQKVQHIPKNGTHGSSSLRDDRNPRGAAENWNAVAGFLKALQ